MDSYDRRRLYNRAYALADDAVKLLGWIEQNVVDAEQVKRDREIELLEGDFHTYARQDRHRKPARPDFGGAA